MSAFDIQRKNVLFSDKSFRTMDLKFSALRNRSHSENACSFVGPVLLLKVASERW